ncbi:MAG: hypothetical protein JJE09_00840, partial [Bacteroidia bacterium]|nr:hypothetical protein [Bacteroidia bacterium]
MEELFTLLDKILKRFSKHTGGMTFTDFFLYGDGYSINKGALIDIRKLLETYLRMAKKFYIQYELSLLKDLDTRRIAQNQAKNALKYIRDDLKGLSSENKDLLKGLKTAKKLLTEDHKIAVAEYKILKENFSTELQKALDKLKEEWQRLEPIAVNSQAFKADKLMPTLKLVGNVAAYSVGLQEKRVVIVPSNVFALEFFTYFENLAVLTVPIYSVRAPWDWSILWHELAGYKVRSLKKDTTINSIKINLSKLLNPKRTTFAENFSSLLARHGPDIATITEDASLKSLFKDRTNKFGKDYLDNLRKLFPEKKEDIPQFLGNHVGDFNHQFEQMLIGLSDEKKNQIKVDGWNVNWFEELFEDAWSVIAMREPFLDFFEDTLRRKGAEGDYRHPPIEIRRSVAKELLKLLNLGGEVEHQPNSTVEARAAKQILKFISLTLAASYDIHKTPLFIKRYIAAEAVSREIGKSILKLSKKFIKGKAPAKDAREYSEKFITNKNQVDQKNIDAFLSSLVDPAEQEKNKTEPSYETLLDGLDYKQLL